MNWIITLYITLLFFVLVPGVLITLPIKRDKRTIAAAHALLFAVIWHCTHKLVLQMSNNISEGFREGATDSSGNNTSSMPSSTSKSAETKLECSSDFVGYYDENGNICKQIGTDGTKYKWR